MDMSKFEGHTPNLTVGCFNGEVVLFDKDGRVNARIGEIGTDDSIMADAELFAAAPDLLDEVKRLREEIKFHIDQYNTRFEEYNKTGKYKSNVFNSGEESKSSYCDYMIEKLRQL